MSDNGLLFSGKVLSLNSQVVLIDAEAKDYPQWKTGEEMVVFGSHGVCVATANDYQVDIIVSMVKQRVKYALCVSCEIIVGKQGILVGNVPAAALTHIQLQPGRYSIIIYTDGIGSKTKRVYFFIESMD